MAGTLMSNEMWWRGLSQVVGSPLDELSAERLRAWIGTLGEGEQLDFKSENYGNGDSARRELAGDLAAFANHRGGVIAIGVQEDQQGVATAIPSVDLSDAEQRRVHQIVAGNVFPHLPIKIVAAPYEDDGRGVLLLAVAPSPLRPHAILVHDGLRYPRRHGTVTRYLSESEVADLYRDRFAAQRSEIERVSELRHEAVEEIDQDGAVWVSIAAVPTGRGSMEVSQSTVSETETWARRFAGNDPVKGFLGQGAPLVRPGLRRLRLMTNYAYESPPNYQYAELHADGAAVAMHRLFSGRDLEEGEDHPVFHTGLTWETAKALNVVAAHAARAGSWGELAIETAVFGPRRYLARLDYGHFPTPIANVRSVGHDLVARRTVDLADVRVGPRELLAATRVLLTDIFNAFGAAEVMVLTREGGINAHYADQGLASWAEQNDVPFD